MNKVKYYNEEEQTLLYEFKVRPGMPLEEVVKILELCQFLGIHVYCKFHGRVLRSENITADRAYKRFYGCSKAKYKERAKKWLRAVKKSREEELRREERYYEYVDSIEKGKVLSKHRKNRY